MLKFEGSFTWEELKVDVGGGIQLNGVCQSVTFQNKNNDNIELE